MFYLSFILSWVGCYLAGKSEIITKLGVSQADFGDTFYFLNLGSSFLALIINDLLQPNLNYFLLVKLLLFLAAMSSSSSDIVTQFVRSFVRPFVTFF